MKHGILIELVDEFGVKGFGEVSPLGNTIGQNLDYLITSLEENGSFLLNSLLENSYVLKR